MPRNDSSAPPRGQARDSFETVSGNANALCPEMPDPDFELLDRWRVGDRRAGDTLLRRHVASLLRFSRRVCPERARDHARATLRAVFASTPRARTGTFRRLLFETACALAHEHSVARPVEALTADEWFLLVLRHELGFDLHELASLCGSSPTDVAERLASAEGRLHARLERG